ncbi:alpha/beta hydrolase [Kineococcus rhizosphaerae]|nr:alpha/beta hydrolase [Kineococcus rhizosphaerae]
MLTGVNGTRTLDPELAALATLIPLIDLHDMEQARRIERTVVEEMHRGSHPGPVEHHSAPRPDGSGVALTLRRPRPASRRIPGAVPRASLPVLVFLHGGSFVTGGLHTEEERCGYYADATGCAVLSVDYRLSPEHPYPAALDDCGWVLDWLADNAAGLGLDPTRVAMGGLSAGGALAAGTALRWRDARRTAAGGGARLQVVLQLLLHPVLDGTLGTASVRLFEDTPIITGQHLRDCWAMYLGVGLGDDEGLQAAVRAPSARYASPGRVDDLAGLPPVFLSTAEFDPLRDEGLSFALGLLAAGIPVELHHYARAFHSFDSFSATRMGRTALAAHVDALHAAFR